VNHPIDNIIRLSNGVTGETYWIGISLSIAKEGYYNALIYMNKDNFHIRSFAIFKGCKKPKRKADYISHNKQGEVSSLYWYGTDKRGDYVIRDSDHWANINCKHIAKCVWFLYYHKQTSAGKCYFSKFKGRGK
jgi:hypothetical protein